MIQLTLPGIEYNTEDITSQGHEFSAPHTYQYVKCLKCGITASVVSDSYIEKVLYYSNNSLPCEEIYNNNLLEKII